MRLRNQVAVCQKEVHQTQEGTVRQDLSAGIKEFPAPRSVRTGAEQGRVCSWGGGEAAFIRDQCGVKEKTLPTSPGNNFLFLSFSPAAGGVRTTAPCLVVHLGSLG